MTHFELVMPKMGESIIEATILRWTKNIGDFVEVDDTLVEIATDKVDTDVPSPVKGKLLKILSSENEVVPVGQTIAIIEMEMEEDDNKSNHSESLSHNNTLSSVESVKPVLNADKLKVISTIAEVRLMADDYEVAYTPKQRMQTIRKNMDKKIYGYKRI
jgi:pyruvate/2-oxoglutarate dehydrogenase complex dihydrolipoamide acyltransferase (E2) component